MIPLFSRTMTGLRFNGAASPLFAGAAGLAVAGSIAATAAFAAAAPLAGWKHNGTLMLLATPEGAHLPAGAVVEELPVLVRLDVDWFDFTQVWVAKASSGIEGQGRSSSVGGKIAGDGRLFRGEARSGSLRAV